MLADLHPGFVYSSILRSGTDHSELDPLPTISKKKITPPSNTYKINLNVAILLLRSPALRSIK